MAIALVGKSLYLLPGVLIIFLCVSYGFRIRDVSQVGTVESRDCTSADKIGGRCSIDDGQGILTLSKKRGDSNRERFSVGMKIVDKIKAEKYYDDDRIKDHKRDWKNEINLLKRNKILTTAKVLVNDANDADNDNKDGDNDDEDDEDNKNDDDDNDDNGSDDEDDDDCGDGKDDADEDDDNEIKKNIKSKEIQNDIDDDDDDEESDNQDIIIENDDDDSEDKKDISQESANKPDKESQLPSPKLELDKKKRKPADDSKLKKPIINPTLVNIFKQDDPVDEKEVKEKKILRKFEKVHLADKDKKKLIEEKPRVNISLKVEKKVENDKLVKAKKLEEPRVVKQVQKEPVKEEIKTNTKAKKITTDQQKVVKKKEPNEMTKTSGKETKKKSKSNSKNKKAVKKKATPSVSLSEFNDEILQLPNFVPNFTAVENTVCQQHGKIFLRQLRGYKLWALQMLDSSGKIPSGLLRGNINQLGDFDECLGVIAHVKMPDSTLKIQGKYCLVNIDIQSLETNMKIPLNLMQSRGFVKGTINDPGHFIPKFTTVNWGLCIPAACTEVDAKNTMESSLSHLGNISGLKFTINVNESNCYVKHKVQNYSKETIGVLYFYAMIVCLVIVATFRDFIITNKDKQNYSERIIMSFSLKKTTKALFKPVDVDSDEITCIHGIRSIATIILYVGHKIISITGLPYTNREALTELANHPITSALRVAVVYTDSFLLISGVLISHSMAKEYAKNGEIRWFCRLIARYIRLTPALLIIIFWYAFIMEHFGSGPQWNSIIKMNADLCKNNAWTNLLYIQNFFPFEEMCATHTHHLAIDMQLSLLAPALVFFLQNKPIIGIILIFFLLQVSATLRYFASINNYLSLVIFHGISIKHLYKTANLTYAVSIHRVTPYLFGIGLGVLLHHTGKKLNIYKIFIAIAWIITILLFTWALFWPWNASSRNYVYNAEDAAHYAVIGPVAWALALCWLIFACFTGYGGVINRCLSNYWLVVFSRISYSVYLTQFAVFFYNAASTRYSTEFQVYKIIDPYEALTVIVISIILTLFFDIPIQEVKNVLMESTKVIKTSTADETDSKHSKDHSKGSEIDNEQSWNPRYYEKFESNDDLDAELNTYEKVKKWEQMTEEYHNSMMNREKRRSKSTPRMLDTHLGSRIRETTPSLGDKRDQLYSRISEPRMFGSSDVSPRNLRKVPVNFISSESEDEPLHRKRSPRRPIERPRVSDEEDWEQELRIRRRRFVEKMTSEQDKSDTDEPDLIRRSSAEGKIALLKGPTGSRVMDAWTVSRGPRALLGSSQETDDDFYSRTDADYSKEIIQDKTSSISNVENRNQFNNNDSISNDNISTIPGKLFKRESIVKSQPSEEDPEYLLPERPKLVEQEQEHPFKKAWQMQKSKSEEDGPSAFAIKEVKVEEMQNQVDQKLPSSIESNIQLIIEDVDVTKKDDNQGRLKPVKQQTISLDDEDLMIDDDVQSPEAEIQNDDCVEKEKLEEDNTQDSV